MIAHLHKLLHKLEKFMKKGFNKYDGNGQEQSHSEPSDPNPNTNNQFIPINYNLFNQFPTFPPNGNFNEGMVIALYQIVQQQSHALQALMSKVETITQRTIELTDKIKDLKKVKKEERETDMDQGRKENAKGETMKNGGDIIEAPALIRILFGAKKQYQYKLRLAQKLDLPLYRQRNFFLEIQLVDLMGNIVRNSNKIPLSLALYSSQNPPKFIEKNTAGQKILKGYVEQSLHQSVCRFQKIQIKEVTSHFRNGWVFIVIIPSMTPLGCASASNDNFIDYTNIEPLVLEKIIVKAKKLKELRKGMQCGQKEGGVEEIEAEEDLKNQDQIYSQQK